MLLKATKHMKNRDKGKKSEKTMTLTIQTMLSNPCTRNRSEWGRPGPWKQNVCCSQLLDYSRMGLLNGQPGDWSAVSLLVQWYCSPIKRWTNNTMDHGHVLLLEMHSCIEIFDFSNPLPIRNGGTLSFSLKNAWRLTFTFPATIGRKSDFVAKLRNHCLE